MTSCKEPIGIRKSENCDGLVYIYAQISSVKYADKIKYSKIILLIFIEVLTFRMIVHFCVSVKILV